MENKIKEIIENFNKRNFDALRKHFYSIECVQTKRFGIGESETTAIYFQGEYSDYLKEFCREETISHSFNEKVFYTVKTGDISITIAKKRINDESI